MLKFYDEFEKLAIKKTDIPSNIGDIIKELSEKVNQLTLTELIGNLENIRLRIEDYFQENEKTMKSLAFDELKKAKFSNQQTKYLNTFEKIQKQIQEKNAFDVSTIRLFRKLIVSWFLQYQEELETEFEKQKK